jgi:phospholipid/cholesterol/gamma-HCH transport system substrate-binding protein
MKSTKNNRPVVVGLFIIIGIAILITAVFTLGGQKRTFVKGFTLNTIFDDVNGLVVGNNVWLSGVKVGTVKKITFMPNTQVLVTMVVQTSLEANIHKDAKTKMSSDGLIGNKIVVILPGTPSLPKVADGDYLAAVKALSTEDMLTTLQANNKNLLAITGSFARVSHNIDSGKGAISKLVNDEETSRKIDASLSSLQSTMNNFQAASLRSKSVIANLDAFTAKLNTKGSLADELSTDTTMFTMLKGTITQLRDVAITAGQLTDNLKGATDRLSDSTNIPGVLLQDKEAAASLKRTIMNLEGSSQKLDEDLTAAQHNFLLRGYFKKKNKDSARISQ